MSETNEPRDRAQTIVAFLKNEMSAEESAAFQQRIAEDEDLQTEVEKSKAVLAALAAANSTPLIRMVNAILASGIERGVSDIHIVPGRGQKLSILFRQDGALREATTEELTGGVMTEPLPFHLHQPIIDRFKTMADMHLGERRLPQDGRLPVTHQNKDYNIRVTTLPSLYGERLTARILPQQDIMVGLERLGYNDAQLTTLRRLIRLRSGLILVGGWVDSGKTTLIYSLLQEMQKPGWPRRNILTVEDPIEMGFPLEGSPITQTAINKRLGLTFAAALHAARRNDPDVIYCGGMRDEETTEICVETALIGHLLLASLPVASALGIVERLRNIGIPNYLIADSVAGLVGVRLARRVDKRQTEEYTPDAEELARLGLTANDGPFLRGVPTRENGNSGFAGRVPLIEIIEVTPALRRLIAEGADRETLAAEAFRNGGSLRDDARAKIKAGLTTVEEVSWTLFDY